MFRKYEKTRLFIEKGTEKDNAREKYRYLSTRHPFKGKDNIEIFIIAMTRGLREGRRTELKGRDGFIRFNSIDDRSMNLIKALAVSEEEDLGVLSNPKKVFLIAEEYANTGIRMLYDEFKSKEEFVGELQDCIIDQHRKEAMKETEEMMLATDK